MNRNQIVLTAMAAGGHRASFDPVQMQKYLFLIDREIPHWVGGPHFRFQPYDYGPFDKDVYSVLDSLAQKNCVNIDDTNRYHRYSLTDSGLERGSARLDSLPEPIVRYLIRVARWVRCLTFRQLLTAIYQRYPDMAVKSVIPDVASPNRRSFGRIPTPSFSTGLARTFDFVGILDEDKPGWLDSRQDALAIDSDWITVGDDLRVAMASYCGEIVNEPKASKDPTPPVATRDVRERID